MRRGIHELKECIYEDEYASIRGVRMRGERTWNIHRYVKGEGSIIDLTLLYVFDIIKIITFIRTNVYIERG